MSEKGKLHLVGGPMHGAVLTFSDCKPNLSKPIKVGEEFGGGRYEYRDDDPWTADYVPESAGQEAAT